MALDYFRCFHTYRDKLAKLSDQEVGRLFRALMQYSETGEAPELAGRESIAFDFIAYDIDDVKEECIQNQNDVDYQLFIISDCYRTSVIVS